MYPEDWSDLPPNTRRRWARDGKRPVVLPKLVPRNRKKQGRVRPCVPQTVVLNALYASAAHVYARRSAAYLWTVLHTLAKGIDERGLLIWDYCVL